MLTEAEIIESAIATVIGVLKLPVLERHKRDVINAMLWKITEARGKYKTRFRSAAALSTSSGRCHHDHVFTRKYLVTRILAQPDSAPEILREAVGCVVTVEEHKQLSEISRRTPTIEGWARYREARILVIDTENNEPRPDS